MNCDSSPHGSEGSIWPASPGNQSFAQVKDRLNGGTQVPVVGVRRREALQTGSVAFEQQRPKKHTGTTVVQNWLTGQSESAVQAAAGLPLQRFSEQIAPAPQTGVPAWQNPPLQVSCPLQFRPSLQSALTLQVR